MKFLTLLLLSASLTTSTNASVSGQCRLRVNNSTISSSWQSSQYNSAYCFNNRSDTGKDEILFFHSMSEKSFADAGYHWFVIALKQIQMIRSVTIKSRVDPRYPVEFRAADIEIWSSMEDLSSQLGSEHCRSRRISSVFSSNPSAWKLCGRTKTNVSKGEYLNTKCGGEIKMLLLRKYVANLSEPIYTCMNFENMWLNTVDVTDSPNRCKISTENGLCNAKLSSANVRVTFKSSDVTKHECKAFDFQGKQLNMSTQTQPTCDVDGNALMSQWLCHNCNNQFSKLTIECSTSMCQINKTADQSCPKNLPTFVVPTLIGTVIAILLISAATLIVCKKRQRTAEESAASSGHQMTALKRQVLQKPPLPPEAAVRALTQSQLSVQSATVDDDSDSDIFQILKTSECCYQTVSPEQQFELSESSRVNSESTVYVEIVSDGQNLQTA